MLKAGRFYFSVLTDFGTGLNIEQVFFPALTDFAMALKIEQVFFMVSTDSGLTLNIEMVFFLGFSNFRSNVKYRASILSRL